MIPKSWFDRRARRAPEGLCGLCLPALLLGGLLLGVLAVCASGQGQEGPDAPASSVTPPPRPTRTLRDAVSAEKVFAAMQQLNAMRHQAGLQAKVAGLPVGVQVESKDLMPKVGGLTPGGWKWLGPANLGGDTLALLPNRKDPRILWAGSAKGGLWYSRNAGELWTIVSEAFASVPISCLAADPTNPDILYVGTGKGIHGHQIGKGVGLLWTSDGGKTWKLPKETQQFLWINEVAVSMDGRVVLVATPVGLMRSTDGFTSWKAVVPLCHPDQKQHRLPCAGPLCQTARRPAPGSRRPHRRPAPPRAPRRTGPGSPSGSHRGSERSGRCRPSAGRRSPAAGPGP
jgi:hypothetical protein